MSDKYVLDGKRAVPCADLLAWARWLETADRIVAKSEMKDGVRVSTVFLGLDHNFHEGAPELFETMIFGGKHDGYQERYPTWDEAEKGHARAVELAK